MLIDYYNERKALSINFDRAFIIGALKNGGAFYGRNEPTLVEHLTKSVINPYGKRSFETFLRVENFKKCKIVYQNDLKNITF